jgi:alkylation response protein AidB-like acyl-CoA dehydrogenase
MNFEYSDEQKQLADAITRFAAKEYSFDKRRQILASAQGCSDSVWQGLAELGVLALPFDEEYGGFGGGAVDLMPVMEAIGAGLMLEPYLSTVGLAAQFIARFGTPAQKARLLPEVAGGALRMAFAWTERQSRYRAESVALTATRSAQGWRLDGTKCMVLHGSVAGMLVVSARSAGAVTDREGISLFLVAADAPGVSIKPVRGLDGRPAADIEFRATQVDDDALIGTAGAALPLIEEVLDFASALVCAEAVGTIEWVNAQTLDYLKTRKQFGKTLGSFQALQHRMVELMVAAEQARSMACLVCVKVDTEEDALQRARVVSAARIRIAQACRLVAHESVQMHGGIGMTDEMKLSHAFRRLTVMATEFGDLNFHLERFAACDAAA